MPTTELESPAYLESTPAVPALVSLNISASVEIEADVRRVLYALATPEYIEAWLQLPDVDRIECPADRRSFDKFRIDLFSSSICYKSIHASCLLSKPNRVTYLWDRDPNGSSSKSVVEMRLWTHLPKCSLNLVHLGLCSSEEFEWHSKVWTRSLNALRGLIEGTGRTQANAACTIG
ncbi:MAG: hypothetical protein WBQ94_10670 [Terracidiphilus sp.]